jgi:hypothetical protein
VPVGLDRPIYFIDEEPLPFQDMHEGIPAAPVRVSCAPWARISARTALAPRAPSGRTAERALYSQSHPTATSDKIRPPLGAELRFHPAYFPAALETVVQGDMARTANSPHPYRAKEARAC